MDKWYLSPAIIVTLLAVQASAFSGSISFSDDRFIGSTVTVQCSWVLSQGDVLSEINIGLDPVNSNAYIYKVFTQAVLFPWTGTQYSQFNDRLQISNVSGTSFSMNISGLLCSDERNFTCQFVYSKNSQAVIPNPSYTKLLDVSFRPDTPEIKQTPTDAEVQEYTNTSVTCTAAFGRPGVGKFQWKVYRAGGVEIIPSDDKRLGSLADASPQASACSQRKGQTFNMQLTRNYQNFSVACFVTSTGYPSLEPTPGTCRNTTSDLCQVTSTKVILYGVSADKMNITMEPNGDTVYQNEKVTLTCNAEGNPPPNYYWTKVEGENSTIVENGSTLVLPSLVVTEAKNLTYNCTATNKAPSAPAAVTATISRTFTVLQTTTSTTTTMTTTTTTASTSTSGKPGDNNTAAANKGGSDDNTTTIIIIVVVVVGVALIVAIIIIIICCKRRRSKGVEEHPEKAYNNRTNPSYQGSQPDLVSDKKMQNQDMTTSKSSLNGSITKEDGLMYADLTYDNRPRSRKPMAINDSSSDYSDIHVPQV